MARFPISIFAAASVAALLAAGVALAQGAPTGDAHHGKALAKGPPELPAEQACSSCHGDTGEGNPHAAIPRLAAQSQDYLLLALAEYANGVRQNEVMTPIAKALDDKQRADVTAYYASLKSSEWEAPRQAKASVLARGESLARIGSAHLGVQGCMNCHGPEGRGLPPTAPYLAGQPAEYLANRLKDWKEGAKSDAATPSAIMGHIARQLDDADIEAVTQYFAQQRPDPIRLGKEATK